MFKCRLENNFQIYVNNLKQMYHFFNYPFRHYPVAKGSGFYDWFH